MNDLINFAFEEKAVRAVKRSGEPWFVLADVCRVLEISNPSDAARRLDEDERMTLDTTDGHSGRRGGAQSITIINESGLYSLILTSRKPEAKRFKKWVTGIVLPAIRKDGGYIAGEEKLATGEMDDETLMARALQVAAKKMERLAIERDTAQLERDTAMEAVRTAAPKVAFHDAVHDTINCVSVGEFAKELGIGEVRFFKWLREKGILLSSKSHWNEPAQRYVDALYMKLIPGRPYKTAAGEMVQGDSRPVITGKGQIWLAKKWRGEDPQQALDLTGDRP